MSNVALALAERLRDVQFDDGTDAKVTLRLTPTASHKLDRLANVLKLSRTGTATHIFLAALDDALSMLDDPDGGLDELIAQEVHDRIHEGSL
jgi:hypothetical protein